MKRLPVLLVVAVTVTATACSGGGSAKEGATVTTAGAADAQTVTVEMKDNVFVQTTVEAKVGKVAMDVKNVGRVPHNLDFDDDALGRTGTVDGGKSEELAVTFDKAGTFTFVCTFHPGMDGKVVVS